MQNLNNYVKAYLKTIWPQTNSYLHGLVTQGKTVFSTAPDFYLLMIYLPHWDAIKPALTPPRFLLTEVPFPLVLSSFSGECL